jgi:hypothetical protein
MLFYKNFFGRPAGFAKLSFSHPGIANRKLTDTKK